MTAEAAAIGSTDPSPVFGLAVLLVCEEEALLEREEELLVDCEELLAAELLEGSELLDSCAVVKV